MIDSYTKTPRPLRDVDVESSINQSKCANCTDKPCLESCPIEAIYVDPNARSKALGTQLLEKIIEIAPTYGIKNIISVVTTDNLPSIKFHERNGFHKEGQINDIAFKFGKNLGVIYYKLVL